MEIEDVRIRVGNNVRRSREQAGYSSQRKLAKHLNISHTKLSNIERGEATASRSDLEELSQKLNVPVESFYARNSSERDVIVEIESLIQQNKNLLKAYRMAVSFASDSRFSDQRIYSLNLLGKILFKLGKYRKALNCWVAMHKEVNGTRRVLDRFKALHNIAFCLFYMNDYNEALRYSKLSLEVGQLDKSWVVLADQLQASILVEMKDASRALAKLRTLLHYYESEGKKPLVIMTLNSIADIYCRRGETEEAEDIFRKSLSLGLQLKDYDAICQASIGICEAAYAQNSDASKGRALSILTECLGYTNEARTPRQSALIRYWMGKCQDGFGKESNLLFALDLSKSIDDQELYFNINLELANYFEQIGDNSKAFQYYKSASHARKNKSVGW